MCVIWHHSKARHPTRVSEAASGRDGQKRPKSHEFIVKNAHAIDAHTVMERILITGHVSTGGEPFNLQTFLKLKPAYTPITHDKASLLGFIFNRYFR